MINFLLPQRAATKETLGHPAAGVIGWLNKADVTSGVYVSEDTALNFSGWWCGVRIISETLASLPCVLYGRLPNGGKQKLRNDDRYRMVHDEPNDEMSAYTFFETGTSHLVSWGNAYDRVVRRGDNFPESLEIRLPDRVTVERRQSDGELMYRVSSPREEVDAADMLHVPAMGFDGLLGYSPVSMARQSLGAALAAEQHAGAQFGNGAVPNGVIVTPQRLKKEGREALRDDWNEVHQGADKAGNIAVLHGGIEYKQVGMNNEDAQFLQSRKFSVEEIARWLRLPLHMLAHLENSSVRANIEQQAIEFVVYCMAPWIKRWEQNLSRRLLRRNERSTMFFEFMADALMRGDMKSRYEAHAIGIQNGWRNVNEVKSMENENPIGPAGDVYLSPLNMIPSNERQPKASVPDSLQNEALTNLTQAIELIVRQSQAMREVMPHVNADTTEHAIAGAIASAAEQTNAALSTIHDDRAEIRKEIEGLGQSVQVAVKAATYRLEASMAETAGITCERLEESIPAAVRTDVQAAAKIHAEHMDRMRAAGKSMLGESLRVLLKIEGGEAIKAAKRQSHHGGNFIEWLDEFYGRHVDRVVTDLDKSVSSLYLLAGRNPEDLAVVHVERSRNELLACADGDPGGFEERVHACVTNWIETRVNEDTEKYHDRIFRLTGDGD